MSRQFSENEEKRLQSEIDTLENSKDELREFLKTKAEIEEMIQKLGQLRERRNSLYRRSRELRTREGEAKDRQSQLRRQLAEARDKKKGLQKQQDTLTEEIDGLYKARQRLRDDFKKYQSEYLTANSRQETEERERESVRRGEERKERRKRQVLEAEMRREMEYDEEKTVCRTLISHLEKMVEHTATNGGPGLDPQRSFSSPPAYHTASGVGRDGGGFEEPGEFLPRKTEDVGGYLVPSSSRRKSKRDRKKNTLSGKAQRRLQYDAVVFSQFQFLSVAPPTNLSTVPQVLQTLKEKLAFYEHKTSTCSEAGDSGISSQALAELAEQDLNSQEEFDHTSPNRHPHKPLPLTSADLSPPQNNGGPVPVSPSSPPLTPRASPPRTDGEEKVLLHSVSTSTTASSNSTTTLVQPSVE
ncbi:hypothetical protein GBAR_LOCUS5157 [Geodia barretti]|nr:hypothetical protein GBAR_LOCUS5157 [Geodia barretti]